MFPKFKSDKSNIKVNDPIPTNPKPHKSSNKNKKKKTKKLNTILKKDSRYFNSSPNQRKNSGVHWDNKAIEEQKEYRRRYTLTQVQRNRLKSLSQTKYTSAVKGAEDDEYLKNLIRVNQIKVNDELIKNIIKLFNEPERLNLRAQSSNVLVPSTLDINKKLSDNDDILNFDNVLDKESKITLQNTIINKFHKEVLEKLEWLIIFIIIKYDSSLF